MTTAPCSNSVTYYLNGAKKNIDTYLYVLLPNDDDQFKYVFFRETTGAVRNTINPRGPTVRPFTRLPGNNEEIVSYISPNLVTLFYLMNNQPKTQWQRKGLGKQMAAAPGP